MTRQTPSATRLQTYVFTSAAREFGRHGQTFSPTTATLVAGARDAVLVDAQFIATEVAALCDMIERVGKRLTAIYVTHAHADHYFGIGEINERFPEARAVTTAPVLAAINETLDDQTKRWRAMFGDAIAEPTALPSATADKTIELEGQELRIIEVGQGDIGPSTIVHIPSTDTVIVGDVAYNRIHLMLALSGPQQWEAWIDSVRQVEQLGPKTVIVGHKAPGASDDDIVAILGGTREYIGRFRDAVDSSSSAEQVVETMTAAYPHYGNLTTLLVSARAAFPGHA
jgi:glyoxylase-like metal-dependent hydrolase (beta-lactamase superfamily II)